MQFFIELATKSRTIRATTTATTTTATTTTAATTTTTREHSRLDTIKGHTSHRQFHLPAWYSGLHLKIGFLPFP